MRLQRRDKVPAVQDIKKPSCPVKPPSSQQRDHHRNRCQKSRTGRCGL